MEKYLIEGEVIDTYGGDYTYRDVWYEIENDEYSFYERTYGIFRGSKVNETERITDQNEIDEYLKNINL